MPEESNKESLHLRVTVGGITIEAEGPVDETETWFEALREDFLPEVDTDTVEVSVDQTSTNPERENKLADNSGENTTAEKSRSLPEYYNTADEMSKKDKALFVGWYLEYHEGEDNFTSKEVASRAEDAKISLGKNVSRDLSGQVKNGYLEVVDQRGGSDAYHITRTGEQYIEEDILSD